MVRTKRRSNPWLWMQSEMEVPVRKEKDAPKQSGDETANRSSPLQQPALKEEHVRNRDPPPNVTSSNPTGNLSSRVSTAGG